MNKLNLICRIVGHKFIFQLNHKYFLADFQSTHTLNEPICKRCGIKLNHIFE